VRKNEDSAVARTLEKPKARRRGLMAMLGIASVAGMTFVAAAPAHAGNDYYGYGSCAGYGLTVVSVSTSTINADHYNIQNYVTRYEGWGDLFLVLPETRRAYPNFAWVDQSIIGSGGWLVSTGRECG